MSNLRFSDVAQNPSEPNPRIVNLCKETLANARFQVVDGYFDAGSSFATALVVACGCIENPAWDELGDDDVESLIEEAHHHVEKYLDEVISLLVDGSGEFYLSLSTILTVQLRAIVRALKLNDEVEFTRFKGSFY